MVGDGFCNDESNNHVCNYDGGDCCLNINTDYCSECICYLKEFCATGFHPLIGDGYCNDETNIAECNYDGGDCCQNIKTNYCSECICNLQGTCSVGFPPSSVGDGFCNDENNIMDCDYDGGDCCVNINTDYCLQCLCHGYGFITSPGYPLNYGPNLDLNWLLEFPLGHYIAFDFVLIHIEYSLSCR